MTPVEYTLSDVLSNIAKKELEVKLLVGYGDSINGYGWHVKYYVEVFKTIEYCSKCRKKGNVDYSDDCHPLNNHKHMTETKCIYSKDFRNENDLIDGLLTLL